MSDRKSDAPSSGPLTEQELDQLGLWHGRGANLRERAAAEIRELREGLEKSDDDNTRLRLALSSFGRHDADCGCSTSPEDFEACSCGLIGELRSTDTEGIVDVAATLIAMRDDNARLKEQVAELSEYPSCDGPAPLTEAEKKSLVAER